MKLILLFGEVEKLYRKPDGRALERWDYRVSIRKVAWFKQLI